MSENVKTYESESIKIYWKPDICKHAGECVRGLSSVFNVNKKPWVSPEHATFEEIMQVIDRCPSRALTYEQKNERN